MDIFSRYLVGLLLAHGESALLVQNLGEQSCRKQGTLPGAPAIHADRGSAMTAKPLSLTRSVAQRTCLDQVHFLRLLGSIQLRSKEKPIAWFLNWSKLVSHFHCYIPHGGDALPELNSVFGKMTS